MYEPLPKNEDLLDVRVVQDFPLFKQQAGVIVANRMIPDLVDVMQGFYGDLFGSD